MISEIAKAPRLQAPRFALLVGECSCPKCRALSPAAAVWVPSFEEHADDGDFRDGGAALLHFIEKIDADQLRQIQRHAWWLERSVSSVPGGSYLENHCIYCGQGIGDHFMFSPGGPFSPRNTKKLVLFRLIECDGPLCVEACALECDWIRWVEVRSIEAGENLGPAWRRKYCNA